MTNNTAQGMVERASQLIRARFDPKNTFNRRKQVAVKPRELAQHVLDGSGALNYITSLEAKVSELREALEAIDKTAFIGVSTLDVGTKQTALESIHDIATTQLATLTKVTEES